MKRIPTASRLRGLVLGGAALAALVPLMTPKPALAWWRGGGFGVTIGLPAVVVPPPVVYAPPPVYYAPPVAYAAPPPHRPVWVPPYWTGTYWVPGHWA